MKSRSLISRFPLFLLPLLLVFAACDSDDPDPQEDDIRYGVNFTRLFSEPTPAEIEAIRQEWAERDPGARDAELVASQGAEGATFHVVQHTMTDVRTGDDFTHYGLVRIPDNIAIIDEDVLLVHHGGDIGVDAETAIDYAQLYPDLFANTIQVFPSYRSEAIRAESIGLGNHPSGGSESPWDYDVDDAIALYDAVRELFPTETSDRAASLSFSRGAGVALLQAVRDERILGVTEYYGPTDFFDISMQELADSLLAGSQQALFLPGAEYLLENVLLPLQGPDGEYNPEADYDSARLDVLRRSPAYFTASLPAVQIHHHIDDPVVPFRQALRLDEMLTIAPNDGVVDNEYNRYNNELGEGESGHHPTHLPDANLSATQEFLIDVYEGEAALVATH